ncbi:phage baseplate assembly protein V [Magnetofaba australis]|uniref:Putative baseplate assembly protein V n=1 Tax=Magnetofaba australis IT-1 TaxID=1434232 RepID=A0A1Y2K0V2_9PROT|nr:phage baseplate assembly protein V [Magnetofaba australis]OSM01661.1 putative baseplate assembly protein V [Magnetofaba australis IT-1]
MSALIAEVSRQLENLVRVGRVESVNYGTARAQVRFGDLVTAPLPWITQRAHADVTWRAPEEGEQVLVLSPSGELTQGVILPALYQNAYPQPDNVASRHRVRYADGALMEHDRAAHRLLIDLTASGGTLEIKTGSSHVVIAPHSVTIRGDVIHLNDDR